jgi:ABC-type multidrug transport system permease subunit
LGAIYWNLGINLAASQNRVGVIFFMCSVLAFSAMSSLELFVSERTLYTREKANGYYRPMAYFFSKIVFDIIPLRVIPPLIIGGISYYMIGLRSNLNHFFWFLLILVLFNIVAGSLCLVIASIAPS